MIAPLVILVTGVRLLFHPTFVVPILAKIAEFVQYQEIHFHVIVEIEDLVVQDAIRIFANLIPALVGLVCQIVHVEQHAYKVGVLTTLVLMEENA